MSLLHPVCTIYSDFYISKAGLTRILGIYPCFNEGNGLKGNLESFIMGIEREMEMNTFFECIVAVGLFIIIGTAGSSDLNVISLTQTILYGILGLVIMFIGIIGRKGTKKER
jgi:formate hydrogenlyase subunit 4